MVYLGKYGAREEFLPQKASVWALKSNDAYGDSNNNNHPDRRRISYKNSIKVHQIVKHGPSSTTQDGRWHGNAAYNDATPWRPAL
uniref:Uncharacterized protein n=1 Tax=Anopheles quadriannulatus TaxID=34691 RepID=A0A182XGW0_ANOQN